MKVTKRIMMLQAFIFACFLPASDAPTAEVTDLDKLGMTER
jgi:hypothetical protein